MFIDRVRVMVKGGNGGNGCCSFRREKFVPRGGPDGGDGGHGGHVIFKVHGGETTLIGLHGRPRYEAQRGKHGEGSNKAGQGGKDMTCLVPPGTVVRDAETGEFICDLTDDGQEFIIARGGRGGKGNARFATSTRRAPRYCEPGQKGEERLLNVELKMIAQVGLVGFPNAGKSTLINALTRAHARIGEYPFTTLSPVIGTFPLSNGETLLIADIPGLIEGAHEGAGLGLDFLRHVERTELLVFVLDISEFAELPPEQALRALRRELGHYQKGLLGRPWIIACNKIDLVEEESRQEWKRCWREMLELDQLDANDVPGCVLSGLTGEGKELLSELIQQQHDLIRQVEAEEEEISEFSVNDEQ